MTQVMNPVEIVDVPHITTNLLDKFAEMAALMEQNRQAAQRENEAKLDLEMVKAERIESEQKRFDGKTVADRERQQIIFLGRDKDYQVAFKHWQDADIAFQIAKQELELAAKELGVWHSVAHVQAAQLNAMATGL